ncbi:hypothetical protein MCOR27_010165 [Pyricularia oryzae]|uniref:Uncharacterized protein n=1 Tax=Pyricularia grisea TaxID=148305 RepID=A0ABQ8NI86_PYRGI|nr:hypothetical protein MCOR02_007537 [Pyricularia oryzae]KAI6297512.1 hypothetical protein MCOR33_006165 [Pyricularia grisea]KAI6268440.1 hypothetical protein MCOR27_010165 [Pyricularia oryzae]KAI6345688.1 hypothetical protein MCOR30_000859 [Pyricularia oryzae]KAI6524936.1 hypothetical protein MCOR10_004771 [Pyricularia oryzae]
MEAENTAVLDCLRSSIGIPANSGRALYDASSVHLWSGSMDAASLAVTEKNGASKTAGSSVMK